MTDSLTNVHSFLKKLPHCDSRFFSYDGVTYPMPYQTITVHGVQFPGLRHIADRVQLFDTIMSQYATNFDSYLDIGCNLGAFVNNYASKFKNVIGIEADSTVFSLATELHGPRFIHANVNNQPLRTMFTKPFDVITALSMIEYVTDKRAFIKDLYDLTGTICIVEGHSADIVPLKRDVIYDQLLREQPWTVIRRPELTEAGSNAPSDSIGRPLWVCIKNIDAVRKRIMDQSVSFIPKTLTVNADRLYRTTVDKFIKLDTDKARGKREAAYLHRLNHPAIPKILDSYEVSFYHVIVMSKMPGETLENMEISQQEVGKVHSGLLSLYNYLSSIGISHGDANISNVLFDGKQVYLIDWEMAKDKPVVYNPSTTELFDLPTTMRAL